MHDQVRGCSTTTCRHCGPQHHQALYELAGFALAALRRTLKRAKRLHHVNEWQFLKAVERAADSTWGPIDFVPMRRRARVGRLDRDAHPAIADQLVTAVDLFSPKRSAFALRVLAELEVEAKAIAGQASRNRQELDLEMYELAVEKARAAGLREGAVEAFALYCSGLGAAEIGRQLGVSRGAAGSYIRRALDKVSRTA